MTGRHSQSFRVSYRLTRGPIDRDSTTFQTVLPATYSLYVSGDRCMVSCPEDRYLRLVSHEAFRRHLLSDPAFICLTLSTAREYLWNRVHPSRGVQGTSRVSLQATLPIRLCACVTRLQQGRCTQTTWSTARTHPKESSWVDIQNSTHPQDMPTFGHHPALILRYANDSCRSPFLRRCQFFFFR